MNISDEELFSLVSTTDVVEWNAVCDDIKKARDGQYPPDWFPVVMMSGLAADIQEDWSAPCKLRSEALTDIDLLEQVLSFGEDKD